MVFISLPKCSTAVMHNDLGWPVEVCVEVENQMPATYEELYPLLTQENIDYIEENNLRIGYYSRKGIDASCVIKPRGLNTQPEKEPEETLDELADGQVVEKPLHLAQVESDEEVLECHGRKENFSDNDDILRLIYEKMHVSKERSLAQDDELRTLGSHVSRLAQVIETGMSNTSNQLGNLELKLATMEKEMAEAKLERCKADEDRKSLFERLDSLEKLTSRDAGIKSERGGDMRPLTLDSAKVNLPYPYDVYPPPPPKETENMPWHNSNYTESRVQETTVDMPSVGQLSFHDRIKALPKFNGTEKDWKAFINLFELMTSRPVFRGSDRLQILESRLTGDAMLFYGSICTEVHTYEELRDRLRRRYTNERSAQASRTMFFKNALTQNQDESLIDFSSRVSSLALSAFPTMPHAERSECMVEIFLWGCRDKIAVEQVRLNARFNAFTSLDEAVSSVRMEISDRQSSRDNRSASEGKPTDLLNRIEGATAAEEELPDQLIQRVERAIASGNKPLLNSEDLKEVRPWIHNPDWWNELRWNWYNAKLQDPEGHKLSGNYRTQPAGYYPGPNYAAQGTRPVNPSFRPHSVRPVFRPRNQFQQPRPTTSGSQGNHYQNPRASGNWTKGNFQRGQRFMDCRQLSTAEEDFYQDSEPVELLPPEAQWNEVVEPQTSLNEYAPNQLPEMLGAQEQTTAPHHNS